MWLSILFLSLLLVLPLTESLTINVFSLFLMPLKCFIITIRHTTCSEIVCNRQNKNLPFLESNRAETIMLAFQPMLRRIKRQINRKRTGSMECDCGARARRNAMMNAPVADSGGACDCSLPPTQTDNMFSFVFTKSRCAKKAVPDYESQLVYEYHTKPLRKVWRSKSFQKLGWNPKNTLILEDTPPNCISNYGNALYIRTYDVTEAHRNDSALLILQAFLDRIRHVDDVRTIEKRDWERLCASSIKKTPFPAPLKHANSAPANIGQQHTTASSSNASSTAAGLASVTIAAPQLCHQHQTSSIPSSLNVPTSVPVAAPAALVHPKRLVAPLRHVITAGDLYAALLTPRSRTHNSQCSHRQKETEEVNSDSEPESRYKFEDEGRSDSDSEDDAFDSDRLHFKPQHHHHHHHHQQDIYNDNDDDDHDYFSDTTSESNCSDDASDEDLSSDEDDARNLPHIGISRTGSLPMTSFCHRMPKMFNLDRLKMTTVPSSISSSVTSPTSIVIGKGGVDEIAV
jgi:hypothetical protein